MTVIKIADLNINFD